MEIGFVGSHGLGDSRDGLSKPQIDKVIDILMSLQTRGAHTLRHGDCRGADEQVHVAAIGLGLEVVRHPGLSWNDRSYVQGGTYEKVKPEKERVVDIVDRSNILIVAPTVDKDVKLEELDSDIGVALRLLKRHWMPVYIVYLDGTHAEIFT